MENRYEDTRTILQTGDTLQSPAGIYTVDACIGRGSNAIVYLGHYADHQIEELQHRILIKELYPFDRDNCISRAMNGDLDIAPSAKSFYALHEESYRKGNIFHANLLNEHPGELDFFIDTFSCHNTLYSILEFTGGRSALQEMKDGKTLSLNQIIAWMKGILNILKVFHDSGYLHLDISLDNILLTGCGEKERVTLIDYNSCVPLEAIHGNDHIILSTKQDYAAPEILRADREKICPGTDLYAVTAVLFHLLFGRSRTMIERKNRFALPDISQNSILNSQYPITVDMLTTILKKGFQANPRLRYQNADQMLTDLNELEARIKCRGITQWALWQKGKNRAAGIIKRNTALHYILDPETLFPIRALRQESAGMQSDEITLTNNSFLSELRENSPVLLLGSGGMGKTTALLRLAYSNQTAYTDKSTAAFYISLFGWQTGDRTYIQDKILEDMDFSHELLDNARKELRQILSEPIHTKNGNLPSLLLCLDGLNEASGDVSPLLDEIQDLCALSGVRIILTSRSDIAGNEYEKWTLSRLDSEEVKAVLRAHQVPNPDNMEIMEMLHIPMMLTMYMEALDGRKLLKLNSRDELMDAYLSVIILKEARDALNNGTTADIQNSPAYLGAEVAVKYILPEIAARLQKAHNALSEKELFQLVEKCYQYLDKRAFTGVFEKWIGHIKDLKLGTEHADEWYRKIVQDILWKKLGLLVKDEDEHYRIVHQIIAEYMAQKSEAFHADFRAVQKQQRNYKRLFACSGIAAVIMVLISAFGIYNLHMNNQLSQKSDEIQEANNQLSQKNAEIQKANDQLTQQNTEILQHESETLAYQSQSLLKNGDRLGAIEAALEALPTDGNERPYVASAEKALADALYVYQDSGYYAAQQITVNAGIWVSALSESGNYFVTLDENGQLQCFDFHQELLLWSYDTGIEKDTSVWNSLDDINLEDNEGILHVLESQNMVVVFGDYQVDIVSLKNGTLIRTIEKSELIPEHAGSFTQCTVSNHEKILAIGYEEHVSGNVSDESLVLGKQIAFYDLASGELLSNTGVLPVSDALYCGFESGAFSEDDSIYGVLAVDILTDTLNLVYTDPGTGAVLQTEQLSDADKDSYLLYSVPEGEDSPGGFLVYACSYDYNINIGYYNIDRQIAFQQLGSDGWNFNHRYSFSNSSVEPPVVMKFKDSICLVFSNDITEFSEDGTSTDNLEVSDNIIYSQITDDHKLMIVCADGTAYLIANSANMKLSSAQNIVTGTFQAACGIHEGMAPFAMEAADDDTTWVLCEYIDYGSDKQEISYPETEEVVSGAGRIYTLPDSSGFIYLSSEKVSQESSDYYNYAAVYDSAGDIIDQFDFISSVNFVANPLSLSSDGRYLCGEQEIYDLSMHQLISLEDIMPEDAWIIKSAVTDAGVFYTCVDQDQLYYWTPDEKLVHSSAYSEQIRLASPSQSTAFDSVYLGQNGSTVLCCSNGERVDSDSFKGYSADYFLVYSVIDDRWTKIDNLSDNPDVPFIAVGKHENQFAAIDNNGKIRIYDTESGKLKQEFDTTINKATILDARYILEDQFLCILAGTGNGNEYQIIDLNDGAIVYTYYVSEASQYSCITETEIGSLLYIYDNKSSMTGVCVDTDNWTEMLTVEDLSGILDEGKMIVNNRYYNLQLIPHYSLEQLIKLGQEALAQ